MSVKQNVFISYSHRDLELLNSFKRHLKPLRNTIDFWDDSRILAGMKWKLEIENALNSAKIAILMISADFFNSEFITSNEIPRLLQKANEDGTVILNVILKPCLFNFYPGLNQYQAINSPDNTIIEMSESEKEKTWVNLLTRINDIDNSRK